MSQHTINGLTFTVPTLDIDQHTTARSATGDTLARIVLERRIVAALIAHLHTRGFKVLGVWDGEEFTRASDAKNAMEAIFNLDECSVRFAPEAYNGPAQDRANSNRFAKGTHGVLLVLGNGVDVGSDWNYYADDRDGFDAAMDAFDASAFA